MPFHSFKRFPFYVIAILVWTLHANASPLLKHEVEELPPLPYLHRRQGSFIPVTGIQGFGVQPRLEIRQLEQKTDQWNIYLLGLARFQATNQSDMLSWYQIAGIHGRPYIPWDHVPPASGITYPGYCHHVIVTLLTWHRAYLALFEQTLYTHIIAAVNEFPAGAARQRYAAAALSWRVPYWDWAAAPPTGQSVYPASVSSPTVTVTMPNGSSTIPNPLFAYNFHPVGQDDFVFAPFAQWKSTRRYPTNWTQDAVSQNALLAPVLDNNRISFRDRLYNLFTNYNNFTEFGNEAWFNGGVSNADSLESIHDAIHSITGSNGHMTYFDYSAYDPLFWLHHGMIDRCFALWQALYNNSYVEPMAAIEQTYTIAVGQVEDVNSPLKPFHNRGSGDFWTSATARSTRTFGYTYSDLGHGNNVSAVKAAINKLYGNARSSATTPKRSEGSPFAKKRESPETHSNAASAPQEVVDGKYREYLANILTEKIALNGSYAIYIFLGDFNDSSSAWPTEPNLVGTHAVFAALSGAKAAGNAKGSDRSDMAPILTTATMPLTTMLLHKVQSGDLPCMDQETLVPYLQTNLHWRVATFDNTQVPVEDLVNLQITVVSAKLKPAPTSDQFPVWSDFVALANVTSGKPGGC